MDNSYILFRKGRPPEPRDKTPDGAVVVRPARRRWEGEPVALVRNAPWVADYRDDVIDRGQHCPLVRAKNATDIVYYLLAHESRVYVARGVFERGR